MAHTRSVTIGPEFFRKTFNDYSDWKYALAREFLQNSSDAPGGRTFGPHNDDYACRLSDLTAVVLQNLKRFGRLFDRGGRR